MHISLHTRCDWTIYRALIGQTFLDEPMNVEVSITLSYFSDSTIRTPALKQHNIVLFAFPTSASKMGEINMASYETLLFMLIFQSTDVQNLIWAI